MAAVGGVAADEPGPGEEGAAAKIKEEQIQVQKVQDWWCAEPNGPAVAASSPVLAALDPPLLAEVIAAGGSYHTILSADRLDGLHRQYGSGSEASLEPLRKALQARGGSKAQARALGMLLFKEARSLLEHGGTRTPPGGAGKVTPPGSAVVASVATPARAAAAASPGAATPAGTPARLAVAKAGSPSPAPPVARAANAEVQLDEAFAPPRRYVCSQAYPGGAYMAARAGPCAKSEMVARLPPDFAYVATGRAGDYLEVQVMLSGVASKAYVLHTIGAQVMLECAVPQPSLDDTFSSPCRWVKSADYPEGAQMAAKVAPARDSKQIATLPADFDYMATGRVGDFLQISLDIDGARTDAYVLHRLGDLVLLVPAPAAHAGATLARGRSAAPATPVASPAQAPEPREAELELQHQRASEAAAAARAAAQAAEQAAAAARAASDVRVEALEARVALQEQQMRALQAEFAQLRSQLASAASALGSSAGGAS